MFWPFKRKKKETIYGDDGQMFKNLYHQDIHWILSKHPGFERYIKKQIENFDYYNYSHNLNYVLHLYVDELIRLNAEIERLKDNDKSQTPQTR